MQQLRNARRRRLNVFRHLQGRELRPLARPVLQRLPVQRQTHIAPLLILAGLLVEPLLRFVAKPLALQHPHRKLRQPHRRALIADPFCLRRKILRHVRQDVHADQVTQPERPRLRPAQRRAGQHVDLLHGEPLLHHQAHRIQHLKCADAVGNEVGRVVRAHHRLA